MQNDLINRSALCEKLVNLEPRGYAGSFAGQAMLRELAAAPAIDAVPVVHGWWVHGINNLYGCSACLERETRSHRKLKKYCPNCGAKMDGGDQP